MERAKFWPAPTNIVTAGYGFSVVVPVGFVVGTCPPVPLWECGVVSAGAVLPVPDVGAGDGAEFAGRPAAPVCSAGGSVASPHHSTPAQAMPARISAAARMISTGSPVRPWRASVAFSTTVGLSLVSIALAPFQTSTTQPRGVRSLDSHSFPGTFCHLNGLEKKEN